MFDFRSDPDPLFPEADPRIRSRNTGGLVGIYIFKSLHSAQHLGSAFCTSKSLLSDNDFLNSRPSICKYFYYFFRNWKGNSWSNKKITGYHFVHKYILHAGDVGTGDFLKLYFCLSFCIYYFNKRSTNSVEINESFNIDKTRKKVPII